MIAGASVVGLSGVASVGCTVKVLEAGVYDSYVNNTTKAELQAYLHWKFGIP